VGRSFRQFPAFVEYGGGAGTVAHSTAHLSLELPVPAELRATLIGRRDWLARRGVIALSGAIHLGGLQAEVVFRASPAGDLPTDLGNRATASIVTAGHAIPVPLQCFAAASEPVHVWARVMDSGRQPPWTEHSVGRCSRLPVMFGHLLTLRGTLHAMVTPGESISDGRTRIEIGGEIRFERRLTARFIARPGEQPSPSSDEVDLGEAVLMPARTIVPVGRHTVWGMGGANPWISLRILGSDGRPLGDEHALGRAMQVR